jgi:glutathione S-transferase
MIKLYHYWSSVCAQKVRMVLAEKKIEWQSKHLDLFEFEQWQPGYLKLNNKGVVPTLDHDGHIVTESNIICEYLEDIYPKNRLRPEDPKIRSQMRKWMLISEEDLHSAIAVASYNIRHRSRMLAKYSIQEIQEKLLDTPMTELAITTIMRLENGIPQELEGEAFKTIEKILNWMEDELTPGEWLIGEDFTLADIAMAPYINRVEVLSQPELISPMQRPKIAEWWARIQEVDSFQEMMAFKNPDETDAVAR